MKKYQQFSGKVVRSRPVDLTQPLRYFLKARRTKPRPRKDPAQGINIAAVRNTPEQRGLNHRCAAPHERIIDYLVRLGQALDKEPGQLRLEASPIRDLLEGARLPLPGCPELINHGGHPNGSAAGIRKGRREGPCRLPK